MIYSSWDIEQNKLKLLISGHFLPFYPPKNLKSQNFEKWIYHKWLSYGVWFLRYWVPWTEFLIIFWSFFDHFLPFYPPDNPKKSKFWKNEKIARRYYHFTQAYHKWQSYDVWFLRYEAWQTESFCYFGPLFVLLPP